MRASGGIGSARIQLRALERPPPFMSSLQHECAAPAGALSAHTGAPPCFTWLLELGTAPAHVRPLT